MLNKKTKEILERLSHQYQGMSTALIYSNAFELMIAVVLSAQCTDERTNIITDRLFPRYNSPEKMLVLTQVDLEELIRDCGLFHNKAHNILGACKLLVEEYDGQLPDNIDELMKLPGVGRKTANVLVSQLFNQPAIAVDTHVFRVANRLELAIGNTPAKVEAELMQVISKKNWSDAHHWLIWHGRKICKARKPTCEVCFLNDICPYFVKL